MDFLMPFHPQHFGSAEPKLSSRSLRKGVTHAASRPRDCVRFQGPFRRRSLSQIVYIEALRMEDELFLSVDGAAFWSFDVLFQVFQSRRAVVGM